MQAYRIERFGSVDGIVLRWSEDPRPGMKEVLMRVRASSLNYPRFDGPQRRRSRSNEDRCSAAVRRRRRGRSDRRGSYSVQNWRSDCRVHSTGLLVCLTRFALTPSGLSATVRTIEPALIDTAVLGAQKQRGKISIHKRGSHAIPIALL
jgi:hypothetical protein